MVGQPHELSTCVLPKPQKVCKIMAFRAVIMGLVLLFYIFWGLGTPYNPPPENLRLKRGFLVAQNT